MRDDRLPACLFYPADFMGGVATMSDCAVSNYIKLLCLQWAQGAIPDDLEALARYSPTIAQAWPEVESKFPKSRDGLRRNERMEFERAKAVRAHTCASNRGKKGGRPKSSAFNQLKADRKLNESSASDSSSSSSSDSLNTQEPRQTEAAQEKTVVRAQSANESTNGQQAIETARQIARDIAAGPNGALSYTLMTDAALRALWESIPANWRKERSTNYVLLSAGVDSIMREDNVTRDEAVDNMRRTIAAYCESIEGKSQYRRTLKRWLNECGWNEEAAAWNHVGEEKPKKQRKGW